MKIFMSWSGNVSQQLAQALREWLPDVVQSVQVFVSSEDIDKGTRWVNELFKELDDSVFGIICITKENLNSPWLNFEAGAVSKSLRQQSNAKVWTLLFGIEPAALSGPLSLFQATSYEKGDVKRLIGTINKNLSRPLTSETLDQAFERTWPELENQLKPLLLQTRKKILWAFERKKLNFDTEISAADEAGFGIDEKWFLDQEAPHGNTYDLIVYAYAQSHDAENYLAKVIQFVEALPPKTPLIIHTKGKRLSEKEFEMTTHVNKMITNMPNTLVAALEKMTSDSQK